MKLLRLIKLDNLKRTTSTGDFIGEIDGLRFLAIISVVILHTLTHSIRLNGLTEEAMYAKFPYNLFKNGQNGVYLFFSISGFILALPFAKHFFNQGKKPKIKDYFIRRLTRLEPPYFVVMISLFIFQLIISDLPFKELFNHLIASIIYSHNIIYGQWSLINPVAWSLEVEVQFYIIAPILFYSFFSFSNKAIRRILIIIAIGLIQIYVSNDINKDLLKHYHLEKSIIVFINYFLLGILLADVFLNDLKVKLKTKYYYWDIIFIASLSVAFYFFPVLPHGRKLLLISMVLIFIAAFKGRITNKIFTNKFISTTGGMCYTIYLVHYPFLIIVLNSIHKVITFNNPHFNIIFQSSLSLLLLWFASSLLFVFIEKPFMDKNWPHKLNTFIKTRNKK